MSRGLGLFAPPFNQNPNKAQNCVSKRPNEFMYVSDFRKGKGNTGDNRL